MSKASSRLARLFRKVILGIVAILGLLLLLIWINVIRFSSRQIAVDPIEKVPVDAAAIQRLQAAIRLPTVSYPDHIDTAAFLQLDTLIRTSFPRVEASLERLPVNNFSQVFRWTGKQSDMAPVLLLAHLDVVPVEQEARSNWSHPPFSGELADGYVWGRGTLDDKVSAFAVLEAIEHLLQEGYTPNRTIYLAFGHDEEVSGSAGAQAIADFFARQQIRFEYILDEGQLILKNALPGLTPPLAMIGIAEKGYLTLDLKVELEEGGHSSMPPPATAIGVLARGIDRLQENPFPARIDGATQGLFEFIGPEMSPLYKTLFANLWLTRPILSKQLSKGNASNAIIRTTTAPTIIQGGVRANVLPSQAQAKINFRILPGETVETVKTFVEQTIADDRITVSIPEDNWSENPSAISGTNSFGFGVIQKTIQQVFPEAVVAPALVIGATDSRHYQAVSTQIYRFQPLVLDQSDLSRIHGIDERVSEAAYKDAIRFYLQLIRNSSI